jgi:MFS family permease
LVLYRSKSSGGEVKSEQAGLLTAAKRAGGSAWLVGLSWGLFNAGLISFFTYAPDYFISRGEGIVRAGLLASYPMWGSIVLAPIVGLLIDRMGHKWVFVAVGCGGTALFLYLIPEFNQHAAILSISIGVFVATLTPAIFSLPAELLPESYGYWYVSRPLYRRQFKGCDGRLPVEFRRNGHFSRHRHNTHVDT